MRTELQKILNLKRFFTILHPEKHLYSLEKPSTILMQNIHANWLNSIFLKTQKHFPIFLKQQVENKRESIPFGFISQNILDTKERRILEQNLDDYGSNETSKLILNLIVPEQDTMQYFFNWQRYRKYWWSSITTTPSFFSIGDIKHDEKTADVNIVAKFPWGQEVVEKLNFKPADKITEGTTHLSCTITLEKSLLILMLDGVTNCTKEGYLRLHRTMTPYPISFALEEASNNKDKLIKLANLLHSQLSVKKISTWLPNFSLTTESQLKENLQMGVAYTAILNENTLSNGIFHLLNSSTMLKEQVHVADFNSYAALICGK